ncbi:MAG: helix-turn-helix domain-containing protein [Myxococcales bacterium]|nr:helix-turn-helix domain-containing protein [Myxococcales bacterium]MCB9690262.1 helix-turn-helix domain-containing protein [Alphaproteobacteria bacterium]
MDLPSVYVFLDYRVFLRTWFDACKRARPGYTYATFAAEAGCSRSALANVMSGARTPRPRTLDAFARAMGLGPGEREQLGLLVELAASRDVRHRRALLERVLQNARAHRP